MDIEAEIGKIKERNIRVEGDKAWEMSFFRRAVIAIGTYFTILIFLLLINAPNPFFVALVPVIAFLLSTLTLPIFKNFWFHHMRK